MPTLLLLNELNGLPINEYLESFDPDAHDGGGAVVSTKDPARALRFPSVREALECWKRPSTVRPVRLDGKPNRPLSAFTVTLVDS